jgi:hypothetical protein
VKDLQVAVGDDCDSEGGVLAAVLGSAAGGGIADGAEECDGLLCLHGVSPFARLLGTQISKGRKVRCSQVAAGPRCQEKKFVKRDPEPARGEESKTRRAAVREF